MNRQMKVSGPTRTRLGGLVSVLALAAAFPAFGQDACAPVDGQLPPDCRADGEVVSKPVAANLEQGDEGAAPKGFSISLDGETIAGEEREVIAGATSPAGDQRGTDLALQAADVQVRYDAIREERRLNVLTDNLASEFRAGDTVTFRASNNYDRWIDRAELRITTRDRTSGADRTVVLPMDPDGTLDWVMPDGDEADFAYVLRVYDSAGRFDETVPARISRRSSPVAPDLNGPVTAAGEAEDRTALRNIPLTGGMVTVSGESLPAGAKVMVMGRAIPVDPQGRFVTDLVLPPGAQNVSVSLAAPGQQGVTLTRQIDIPRSDWFATGLADVTIGKRGSSLSDAQTYRWGHLAFYAKGVVASGARVTASFDSGEEDLDDIFDDVLNKNPRSVLDRIDRDDLYPTYGDDSRIVEDAPTSGKLYLKVEKDGNHLMWGDFKAGIDHSAFLSATRNLYGAQGVYRSPDTTLDGERRVSATLYAAQPESLPQRDELRGTGGSVYVLKRRDLVSGSETLRVEIVDPVTGRVVSTRTLAAAEDYRIDYFQGTVILTEPLTASAAAGGPVTGGPSGDYVVNLVAQYEYIPTIADPDGAAFGGRVETWLPGDRVRLGVTAMDETTDTADLQAQAIDLRFQISPDSHIDAEVAESTGTGFGRSLSTDGGFTWVDEPATTGSDRARALRFGAEISHADLAPGADGTLRAWYEDKEAGFQTLSEDVSADQTVWGFGLQTRVSDRVGLSLGYEDFKSDDGTRRTLGEASVTVQTSGVTEVQVGVTHRDEVQVGDPEDTGKRTDLGLKITRDLGADQSLYLFGQATVARSGGIRRNDRIGFGLDVNLTDTVGIETEISDGTNGIGARALLDFRPTAADRFYLGYELDPNRDIAGTSLNGDHKGRFLLGAEREVDQGLSYFVEDSYDLFGNRRALTQAYGVTYTPSQLWSWSANLERGRIVDTNDADSDYTAIGVGSRYDNGDGVQGKARLEYRIEDHEDPATADRTTWALLASYSNQVSEDWRFLADIDALVSDSDQEAFLDGRYVEASLGYAWRPTDNDRWNVLARYTYLYDLPGADQISADGSNAGDKQRSHIFSVDAIFDPDAAWEFGGKLAYRIGETAPRTTDVFTDNDAGLLALRATYAFESNWELSGETRLLWLPDAEQTKTGTLLTVYRSFGDHAKVGLGYNFGEFSDDLRDTTLDDRGLFLNLQAKF
ncbi:hypothetical protein [Tabrizicola sp.]|uniref:hypothetical protein n=1 Tax=Tabrizicola sp. TaxID=2005166 RepID=UPI0035B3E2B1